MFEPEVEYTYWPPEPSLPYEPYRGEYTTLPSRSQQQAGTARTMPAAPARLQRPEQVRQTTPRMSKAEALAFVEQCKKWLVTGSIVAFAALTGLVASHVIGS